MYGGEEMCIQGLVGRPEEKRPPGRPKCRQEDNIEMNLLEVEWGAMDCIDLAQDRDWWQALLNMMINLQVP